MKLPHPLTPSSILALTICLSGVAAAQQEGSENAANKADKDSVQWQTSGGPLASEQAAFDVLHYDLKLRVDPKQKTIEGALTMRARMLERVREIRLDLHDDLDVKAVHAGGRKLNARHTAGQIWIDASSLVEAEGQEFELVVEYGGTPLVAVRPPWTGGFTWAVTADESPWIATSCQGEGADLWWPCKDHPSDEPQTMDMHFTVPDPLVVASNGKLLLVEQSEIGWSTYHWHVSTPINTYGVAFNAAPYKTISADYESTSGDVFPITYWVLPENFEKGKELFPQFARHLRFFEETFGPYPFRADKYGVVETPHLGMEHQTIIAYGNQYKGNPWGKQWGFDNLHHHELAHEWWGNLVTVRDWKDFWIHEGFGTYCQSLYTERLHGEEAYLHEIHNMRRLLNRAAVAPRESRSTRQMYFSKNTNGPDSDIYFKGAFVLHSLRWVMGDEPFFEALRRMAYPDPQLEQVSSGEQCRHVDTEEFRAIAERAGGAELDWFFELYLRQPHLPELESEVRDGVLHLAWKTPDELPFPMPVPVRIGSEVVRVEMPGGRATVELGGAKADEVEVDPKGWVLRKAMPQRETRDE